MLRTLLNVLPKNRRLASKVGSEMNQQISNYIRGKVTEIIIVGIASYVTFEVMDLRYAVLLGVLVGLSVLIPYIGAAAVTVPGAAASATGIPEMRARLNFNVFNFYFSLNAQFNVAGFP